VVLLRQKDFFLQINVELPDTADLDISSGTQLLLGNIGQNCFNVFSSVNTIIVVFQDWCGCNTSVTVNWCGCYNYLQQPNSCSTSVGYNLVAGSSGGYNLFIQFDNQVSAQGACVPPSPPVYNPVVIGASIGGAGLLLIVVIVVVVIWMKQNERFGKTITTDEITRQTTKREDKTMN